MLGLILKASDCCFYPLCEKRKIVFEACLTHGPHGTVWVAVISLHLVPLASVHPTCTSSPVPEAPLRALRSFSSRSDLCSNETSPGEKENFKLSPGIPSFVRLNFKLSSEERPEGKERRRSRNLKGKTVEGGGC